jgi:hypothetical protein
MSLCWCSNTEEGKASLNVRLLLALDEFLFEDIPRCAGLLSIRASAGAAWFFCSVICAASSTVAEQGRRCA